MIAAPSSAEQRANATFEALLWALSRPGQIRTLPEVGEGQIIDALLDRECRAYGADPLILPAIMRSGAQVAELPAADHVFLGTLTSLAPLREVAQGSDLYPDDGATVILNARFGAGQPLRLSGPGIEGVLHLSIDGVPEGFWQERAHLMRYPMGFELVLLDGDRVMGLPRSTKIEVL